MNIFLHRKYLNFIDLVIMNIHQSYMNIQTSVTCFSWWIWLVGRKRGRSFSKRHVYNGKWRHNGRDGVSNHQPHDCLHNRLFRRRSKKTSKLRVIGLCVGNSPGPGEFPAQMTSNAETVSFDDVIMRWWQRGFELHESWQQTLHHDYFRVSEWHARSGLYLHKNSNSYRWLSAWL